MPEETMASIEGPYATKKKKFVSSFFAKRNARRMRDAVQQASQISAGEIRVGEKADRGDRRANLAASERDAEIDRLQCGRVAAPVSAVGLLERESLFDPEPMRDTEAVPASGGWVRLAGLQIPARASTTRCDRAADRKRRKHDHLDLGCYQRALLGHLAVDLKHAADP